MVQNASRELISYLIMILLLSLAASCGGGGASDNNTASINSVQADAGSVVGVIVGNAVVLDGSGSTSNPPQSLNYRWSILYKPHGSKAELQNPNSASPSFIADVVGSYRIQLLVSVGGISSQRAIASVEASRENVNNLTGIPPHNEYSSRCETCHDGRYTDPDVIPGVIPSKSGSHPATSRMCEACHSVFGFNVLNYVDHQEVFENCSSCHNGITATGKSDFHIQTNGECDSCHNTTSFLQVGTDGRYDHSGISSGCSVCHNGTVAVGKHDTHPFTSSDCHFCHSTDSFANAYPDHNGPEVVGFRCDSCHNAAGSGPYPGRYQPVGHPVMEIIGKPGTNIDCGVCHSTNSFYLGGVYNHRLVDSNTLACSTCHAEGNSFNARSKADKANHVVTDLDCGVCHAIRDNPVERSFKNGIFDHSTVVGQECIACHTASPNGPGDGSGPLMHTNHMDTPLDCGSCHTTGTFTTGVFDHDFTVYNPVPGCNDCHNGKISIGKLITHIPTSPDTQSCGDCHTTDTFIGVTFDHSTTTLSCSSCHDGAISTGQHQNHLPTSRDCGDCHATPTVPIAIDFTGGSFDHAGVSTCASCHNGVIARDKAFRHIPAQAECSQCHIDTSVPNGFTANIFLGSVHPDLTGGCEGCHNSKFLNNNNKPLIKAAPPGHLPTEQDCHFCHANDVPFIQHQYSHAGITGNCSSCHDGNYLSIGALGKISDPTPPHPTTTADCGICHGIPTSTQPTFASQATFDHTGITSNCSSCHGDGVISTATKKHDTHVPTNQDCSICHVPGTFTTAVFSHTGITSNCLACHNGTAATATVKPAYHLPTSSDCANCHNTTAFAGARYDHAGINSNCAACHDGFIAKGKVANHFPTNRDCAECHLTTGFLPASFDHAGITNNCDSCHDGYFARGKINGHVPTSLDCGACHNIAAFKPATYDHSTITTATRCDSCHVDGSASNTGKDDAVPAHLPTELDCRACHTTATFIGGSWVHDASTAGICDTCHSPGGGARAKPSGHLSTSVQCDACHTTNGWVPTDFTHDPNGNYPGDHRRNLSCGTCHGSSISLPFAYRFDQYKPDCAACHANDFDSVSDHNGGRSGTVAQNQDCSGGGRGCHRVSDDGF